MPERNATTNTSTWKQLIGELERFASGAAFTTNDVQAALGDNVKAQFLRDALTLCANKGWIEKTGTGKHRQWNVLSYDALKQLTDDDIETLDRERAASRSKQTAKRRSRQKEEKRKASAPPAWKKTLQGHLTKLTAHEFEKLAALIMVAEGHTNVVHTPFHSDGGKDIIADYPVSRMISQRVLVECKHTTRRPKANVGKSDYDEFYGVISRTVAARHGMIMTNGGFTHPVKDLAADNPAITLQGLDEICDILKDDELLVTTHTHSHLALDVDYFDPSGAPTGAEASHPTRSHPDGDQPSDPHAISRELVDALGDLDAEQFRRVAADILAAEGCHVSREHPIESDADHFAVASSGQLCAPQQLCICFRTTTGELTTQGIEDLRKQFGEHTGQADSGLLITQQRCNNAARAAAAGKWPIRILDINDLCELLIKHHIGITNTSHQTVDVPNDFADFHAELERLYDTARNDGNIQTEDRDTPTNGQSAK